jgi:hypothetical protein
MTTTYVLNSDHTVEPMDDLVEWTNRREIDDNMIAHDVIPVGDKSIEITTTFTGIMRPPSDPTRPLVFETAVFGYESPNDTVEAYATYADAQKGHDNWVFILRNAYASESSPPSSPPESSPKDSSPSGGDDA